MGDGERNVFFLWSALSERRRVAFDVRWSRCAHAQKLCVKVSPANRFSAREGCRIVEAPNVYTVSCR